MPLVWMSRSAIPAARIATMTPICAAFARIATMASVAWLTTPVEMVAASGTRVASADAETDSRVPSAGWHRRGDWAKGHGFKESVPKAKGGSEGERAQQHVALVDAGSVRHGR
jgi:hypothetical protein